MIKNLCLQAAHKMGEEYPFRTQRLGSGMGMYLEFQWGKSLNKILSSFNMELGQLPDQYNDYACLRKGAAWNCQTKEGELFRIEVKSMHIGADECKGHFSVPIDIIGEQDLLVIIIWNWSSSLQPVVVDFFVDLAKPIAKLRDALHLARGGTFVDRDNCPDGCEPEKCTHHGEALNSKNVRETPNGPETCRGKTVSYANNFGGLVRMTKTRSKKAKKALKKLKAKCEIATSYLEFINRVSNSKPCIPQPTFHPKKKEETETPRLPRPTIFI